MGSSAVAGTVFACTFGAALAGMGLRRLLPEAHLGGESKDVVKMGTGLVATLAALVLGLLVASAKGSFDAQRSGFQQLSANLILVDRSLHFYGPEADAARKRLRDAVGLMLDHRWPADGSTPTSLDARDISASGDAFYAAVRNLSPQTEAQKVVQAQALQLGLELGRTRWALAQGEESAIATPFLTVLVFWLAVLFATFGLFSPPNATVVTVLMVCAASVAGALFLISELDQPFHGLIQISSKPLRDAFGRLGQ